MGRFVFKKEDHSYWLEDQRLPSVTGVLRDAGLSIYHSGNSEYYMERGTLVHTATEMIDKGTLDWNSLDPVLLPYCEAYAEFCSIMVNMENLLISESPMYHPQHLYAGTPDRLVPVNGMASLIDIKSGGPHPTNLLQVAGYWEMARAYLSLHISRAYILYLRNDGTYRFIEVLSLRKHLQTFLAVLSAVRWKEANL